MDKLFSDVMKKWPTLNIASIYTFTAIPSDNYSKIVAWYPVNKLGLEESEDDEDL